MTDVDTTDEAGEEFFKRVKWKTPQKITALAQQLVNDFAHGKGDTFLNYAEDVLRQAYFAGVKDTYAAILKVFNDSPTASK